MARGEGGRSPRSPVQVVARSPSRPLGGGGGVLREPDKAEPHAALRRPGPLAGGDGGCRFRAGHGRTAREKTQQRREQVDTELARPPEFKSPASNSSPRLAPGRAHNSGREGRRDSNLGLETPLGKRIWDRKPLRLLNFSSSGTVPTCAGTASGASRSHNRKQPLSPH